MNILKGTFKRLKARYGEPVTIVRDLGVFTDYGTGEEICFTISNTVNKAVCLPYGTKFTGEPHTTANSSKKFGYGGEEAKAYLTFMVDSDDIPAVPTSGYVFYSAGAAEQVTETDITKDSYCYYVDGYRRQLKDGKFGKYTKGALVAYLADSVNISMGLDLSVTCSYGTFKVLNIKESSDNAAILTLEKVL